MRVALFFDGKNFYKALTRSYPTLEINYDKLVMWVIERVAGNRADFAGAWYYTGHFEADPKNPHRFSQFLTHLNLRTGFFVRREPRVRRRHRCRHCGETTEYGTEKRVDTRLVADMIHYAAVGSYDVAILFSGDQDLLPAVESAHRLGRRVYVATWLRQGLSPELRSVCFGEIELSDGIQSFATGRPPRRLREPCINVKSVVVPSAGSRGRAAGAESCAAENESAASQQGQRHAALNQLSVEVRAAAERLPNVSRWFFENKWRTPALPPAGSHQRKALVNEALASGLIEVYSYTDDYGRATEALKPSSPK